MNRLHIIFFLCVGVALFSAVAAPRSDLQVFMDCQIVPSTWADGDSFQVRLPGGKELTLRLYGVDCIETTISNETMARRLRAQRRYFGIGGSDGIDSAEAVRIYGVEAAKRTTGLLADSFSVETAFTDARGSGLSPRVYAFVTLKDGRDLAAVLVEEGMARAFGVVRSRSDGTSGDEYREHLADLELVAAASKRGVWAMTNWAKLPADRAQERGEQQEIISIMRKLPPTSGVDPNSAPRELLETLPGIGPVLAERIESERTIRPFLSPEDLLRVKGISSKVLKEIAPHLRIDVQKNKI